MLRLVIAAAFALGLMPAAMALQTDAAAATASETSDTAPKSKMICRTMPTLGSRLAGKRECATSEEWARMQAEHREALQKQQTLGLKGE